MPTPNEKLAESLTILRDLQKSGRRVFQSQEFTRTHRERLADNGFLQEVMKGWLISSSPGARIGDSTPWYASFWEFCGRYCDERFAEEWYLSPEQSRAVRSLTCKSDVFALGVVVQESLLGRHPTARRQPQQIGRASCRERV